MTDATEEVRAVMALFSESWNRHDIGQFSRLFAEDAQFVNVVGLWWNGRDEITKAHEFTHATIFRNSRLTMEEVSVRFPADRLAIARARWRLEGHVSPEHDPLPPRNGILLAVLARDGTGDWTIIDAQNTDVIEGELSRPQ